MLIINGNASLKDYTTAAKKARIQCDRVYTLLDANTVLAALFVNASMKHHIYSGVRRDPKNIYKQFYPLYSPFLNADSLELTRLFSLSFVMQAATHIDVRFPDESTSNG